MIEKFIVSTLKSASAVVYAAVLLLVLSIPVIFIYQAFLPPQFVFDSVAVTEDLSDDIHLSEEEKSEEWVRVDFSLTASSGKFSPYSFYIEQFSFADEGILDSTAEYKIILDEPIECTKDVKDPFTLSVYIKGETDINEFVKTVSFKATDFNKSFGEFSLKFVDGKAQLFKK